MAKVTRRQLGAIGTGALLAPALGSTLAEAAGAPVKIGAIYPLSGAPTASAGQALQAAQRVAMDIVNNAHPELKNIPLAPTKGLPKLGGRTIEVVFADSQGNPATAQSQALRLITQERVVALVGCYESSCTLTASAVSERYGIPFVAGESSSPNLTERGFKWFFRPTPIGTDFGKAYASFLKQIKAAGQKVDKISLVNENTEYGTATGGAIIDAIKAIGMAVQQRVTYAANASDLSSEVLQLKQANPDVVIFVSYTADAILYMKTMKNLNYKPAVLIGDDSGFSDTAFLKAVGNLAEGAINRSSYDIGKPGGASYIVNQMYQKVAGHALDDTSARGLEGALSLYTAINQAGSTAPAKIQAALRSQDLKADQLMIGYEGIKYGPNGQNTEASTLLVQLRHGNYVAVWPDKSAVTKVQLPFKGWS